MLRSFTMCYLTMICKGVVICNDNVVYFYLQSFAVATPEELEANNDDCAICWDSMQAARKLPCGHLFHKYVCHMLDGSFRWESEREVFRAATNDHFNQF